MYTKKIALLMLLASALGTISASAAEISGSIYMLDGTTRLLGERISVYAYDVNTLSCTSYSLIQSPRADVDPSTGTFRIAGLAPGTYRLKAVDYHLKFFNVYWAASGSVESCNEHDPITLTSSTEVRSNINFQMRDKPRIAGTVYRDTQNNPLLGTNSKIKLIPDDSCNSAGTVVAVANIDPASGTFAFKTVPYGKFRLYIEVGGANYREGWLDITGRVVNCENARSMEILQDTTLSDVDFYLEKGSTLSGTLFYHDGTTALTNVEGSVRLYSGTDCSARLFLKQIPIVTENGTFRAEKLWPGKYYLRSVAWGANVIDQWYGGFEGEDNCQDSAAIEITGTQDITGLNFTLLPGATLSGKILEADGITPLVTPSSIGGVSFYTRPPCQVDRIHEYPEFSATVDNLTGEYQIDKVPPGTYYVSTRIHFGVPNEWSNNYLDEWWAQPESTLDCSAATPLVVERGGTLSRLTFQVDQGAVVEGKIVMEDGTSSISGQKIVAYTGDPCNQPKPMSIGATSGTSNEYIVKALPSGTYYLKTISTQGPYVDEWWNPDQGSIDCQGAAPLQVTQGETMYDIDFRLHQGATITGRLYKDDGVTPLTSSSPLTIRTYVNNPCISQEPIRFGIVDKTTGSYIIQGLPSGSYFLQAVDDYWQTLYSSSGEAARILIDNVIDEFWASPLSGSDCAAAHKITVSAAEKRVGVDFQLTPWVKVPGDVNLDGMVTLPDAISILQLLAGEQRHSVWHYGDIDGNGRIDIQEAVFICQQVAQ